MVPRNDDRSLAKRSDNRGLQQQGSIDWVKLAGSTVSFTVESLGRLSNAGIEALTVCAAEAMFSRLVLSHEGETRMQAAVSQLKAFSSFNNVLWFGFGVKHVIRKLAESSEGLNCIAICAALSECYSAMDSARILKAAFVRCNAPKQLTPSLRQWLNLVEACEGALAATDFGVKVHDISRLCLPDGVPGLRNCSDPEAIADALEGIIKVSNGSQNSISLIGGADCGWMAAFSTWLLDLSLEVRNVSGDIIYPSNPLEPQSRRDPQIIIVYEHDAARRAEITKNSFAIPAGRVLLHQDWRDETVGTSLSYGRVPWSSALRDTFGNRTNTLIHGGLSASALSAVGCAARILSAFATKDPSFLAKKYGIMARIGWRYLNPSSHGQGFINTIQSNLPEIATSETAMEIIQSNFANLWEEAVMRYGQAMALIAAACSCDVCQVTSNVVTSSEVMRENARNPFCLVILVEVIIELVQVLSIVSMDSAILPTRAGLEKLYWNRYDYSRAEVKPDYINNGLFRHAQDHIPPSASVLDVFSGRRGTKQTRRLSAQASSGICFYLDTLVTVSSSLEKCFLIHLTPGRIEWDGHIFEEVIDLEGMNASLDKPLMSLEYEAKIGPTIRSNACAELVDTSSPDIVSDLLIEEKTNNSKSISATYRFVTALGRFHIPPWQGASAVARALSGADCKGRECAAMPPFDVLSIQGEGLLKHRLIIPAAGAPLVPLIRVLPLSAEAQWVALSQESDQIPDRRPETAHLNRWNRPWRCIQNRLQGNRCLYCLLMSAVHGADGPDIGPSMNSINVCIVTST